MNNSKISRNVRRGLAAAVVAGAGVALAVPGAQAADTSTWDALAECESSGNWATSTGNGFSGGLQFTDSTWQAYGGSGSPANASREEQIRVAENVLAGQGWGAWPACSAKLGLSGTSGAGTGTVTPQSTTPTQGTETSAPAQEYTAPAPTYTAPAPTQEYVEQAPVQEQVEQAPQYVAPAPVQEAAPVETYAAPEAAQVPQQVTGPVETVAPVQETAPALSGETYVIQSGDTLSGIAEKLGIEGGWQALYNANADTIIHPDLIFTGAVLQLPA